MCMCCLLLFSIVIQTIFLESDAIRPRTSIYRSSDHNEKDLESKFNPQVYKKTAELLNLIDNVYNKNENSERPDFSNEDSTAETISYVKKDKEMPVKDIMEAMQRNYDIRDSRSNVSYNMIRTHYISNPEEIDRIQEFDNKDRLQYEFSTSSDKDSSTEEYRIDKNLKEILAEIRRRTLNRIVDGSEETKTKSSESNHSVRDVRDDNKKDDVKDSQVTISDDNNQKDKTDDQEAPVYEEGTNDINRKSKEDKFEEADAWEVVTMKYDWSADKTSDNENRENINIDWGKNNKENYRDNEKTSHNQSKKSDKLLNKHKHLDDESNDVNENAVKEDRNSNKRKEDISDWENKHVETNGWHKKKVREIESDWGKKRKTDSWEEIDGSKSNKHETTLKNKWYSQGDRFETNKETNFDTHKYEWDRGNKRKRDRTTRGWMPDAVKINEWASYNPRKERKGKRQNYDRNRGTLMRTSIPYVGKKGIYDDK